MSELDNLLGSRISLISQVDVRYDGVLFSINAKESSIVLKDVRCLGTEERVTDSAKKVPPSSGVLAFVAFPGSDIKDLYLHGHDSATPEPPAPEPPKRQQEAPQSKRQAEKPRATAPPPVPPAPARAQQPPTQQPRRAPATQHNQQPQTAPKPAAPRADKGTSGIGTGEHLLHLRPKRTPSDQNQAGAANAPNGVFDFAAALSAFNKTEVMESVAKDPEGATAAKALYKKDDFFDTLSCDVLDREMGRRTHMTNSEERHLNQDTFGAVALQSSYSRGRRYNGSGGGRGTSGRGDGGRGGGNQGRGRGRGGGGGYRGGRGRGGGRGGVNHTPAP